MSSDNSSVAPSILSVSTDDLKLIKREMKGITDEKKLRQYILERSDLLNGLKTELLNSYHGVQTHKLVCRRGILGVVKNDTREKSLLAMRKDIDKLITAVTKIGSIVDAVIQLNQLRLPE
jgi:hypothetical protein